MDTKYYIKDMETVLVKISEAAKMLGVSTKTLRRWDNADKLKPVRTVGKHRRYRVSDIKKLLEEQ